jgi:hypothetical protein
MTMILLVPGGRLLPPTKENVMNRTSIPENDWKKVKTEIQKKWSGLSSEELEKTHGDVSAISRLVQKKFGLEGKDAENKLDEVIKRCGTSAGEATVESQSKKSKDIGKSKKRS